MTSRAMNYYLVCIGLILMPSVVQGEPSGHYKPDDYSDKQFQGEFGEEQRRTSGWQDDDAFRLMRRKPSRLSLTPSEDTSSQADDAAPGTFVKSKKKKKRRSKAKLSADHSDNAPIENRLNKKKKSRKRKR